jgi:hypothetical protein
MAGCSDAGYAGSSLAAMAYSRGMRWALYGAVVFFIGRGLVKYLDKAVGTGVEWIGVTVLTVGLMVARISKS